MSETRTLLSSSPSSCMEEIVYNHMGQRQVIFIELGTECSRKPVADCLGWRSGWQGKVHMGETLTQSLLIDPKGWSQPYKDGTSCHTVSMKSQGSGTIQHAGENYTGLSMTRVVRNEAGEMGDESSWVLF